MENGWGSGIFVAEDRSCDKEGILAQLVENSGSKFGIIGSSWEI
jgi:hypothetical protein